MLNNSFWIKVDFFYLRFPVCATPLLGHAYTDEWNLDHFITIKDGENICDTTIRSI